MVFGGLGEWFADENRIAWSKGVGVQPTDTSSPDYFHKVVDCQWACPAHTNVPGYIRLIAQGRFDDAYMLNRESNVFPGILGRTVTGRASRRVGASASTDAPWRSAA